MFGFSITQDQVELLSGLAFILFIGVTMSLIFGVCHLLWMTRDKRTNPRKNDKEAREAQESINKWKELNQ